METGKTCLGWQLTACVTVEVKGTVSCFAQSVTNRVRLTNRRRMMQGFTAQVRQFTTACKPASEVFDVPTRLPDEKVKFIRQMVDDEMTELAEADNVVDQADALVDAIYYICETAATQGINLDPLFAIVHGANMQKVVDGKVIRRESDGKIMKPEGWVAPEPLLAAEVARQTAEGAFE